MSMPRSAPPTGGAPRSATTAPPCAADARLRNTPNCSEYSMSALRLSTLYLHGTDDGCSEDYTPWIERVLPEGSTTALVENAGHFLQLEQPAVVARHIIDFVGAAR